MSKRLILLLSYVHTLYIYTFYAADVCHKSPRVTGTVSFHADPPPRARPIMSLTIIIIHCLIPFRICFYSAVTFVVEKSKKKFLCSFFSIPFVSRERIPRARRCASGTHARARRVRKIIIIKITPRVRNAQ